MTAMETLLAIPFEKTFSEVAPSEEIKKIRDSLFENYHITLESSLREFEKFEFVAEHVLGNETTLIKKTFDKICQLKSKHVLEIKDESLQNKILETYNNPLKKHILGIAFDYPLTLWQISSQVKIGMSCISKNISDLILDGLLATNDMSDSEHNKKYYSTIDEISTSIHGDKISMYVTINDIANDDSLY